MNKLSSFAALVTAALIGIVAESAWSNEATSNGSAKPAAQIPAPTTGVAPGWYPPPPNRGGYTRPWPQQPQRPVPPRGYGQLPPHYPPPGQYRAVPAAPAAAVNPLSAELKQTQEQLTAKSTELDMTHAMLEQLRGTLQYSIEAERALREKVADITSEQQALQARVAELTAALNTTAATLEQYRQQITNDQEKNRMLTAEHDRLRSDLTSRDEQLTTVQAELQTAREALQQAQAETFNSELTELKAQLESQKTTWLNAEQTGTLTAERDRLRSDLANRDEQLATVQAELQAATQALQQAQDETSISGQQLSEARSQAETLNNELAELKTQLESQKTTVLDTEQMLATVIAECDGLQVNLTACSQELTQAQAALTDIQSEKDALRQAHPVAAELVIPVTTDGTDKAVEPAVSEELGAGTAEVAALQNATTDTDGDGVPDSIDLCPEAQHGIAVNSTGCAAGVAINLEGVNFLYNSHELTDKAQRILDRVADVITQQPELRLEVAGHTDATGDPAYNQELSMQRAEAVRDYLVVQGVNAKHIGATGYGGQRPIADNTTFEGLQKNRRVELRVLQ